MNNFFSDRPNVVQSHSDSTPTARNDLPSTSFQLQVVNSQISSIPCPSVIISVKELGDNLLYQNLEGAERTDLVLNAPMTNESLEDDSHTNEINIVSRKTIIQILKENRFWKFLVKKPISTWTAVVLICYLVGLLFDTQAMTMAMWRLAYLVPGWWVIKSDNIIVYLSNRVSSIF